MPFPVYSSYNIIIDLYIHSSFLTGTTLVIGPEWYHICILSFYVYLSVAKPATITLES